MSNAANKLFESLQLLKDGVQSVAADALSEGVSTLSEKASHGATELAAGLFNQTANSFVMYGPGRYPASQEQAPEVQQDQGQEIYREQGLSR